MKCIDEHFFTIKRASEEHIDEILSFEARNQLWFSEFFPKRALASLTKVYFIKQLCGNRKVIHHLIYSQQGRVIGRFCTQFLDDDKRAVEVSYRLEKRYTQQGIARQVLRRLLLVYACYGVSTVHAHVGEKNTASIRLLCSCGFVHAETEHQSILLANGVQDRLGFRWDSQL